MELIFPDAPLEGTPEQIAWAQEMTLYLNQLAVVFTTPSLVTGITAVAGDTVVRLAWRAAPGASKYRIYRNDSGDFNTATIVHEVVGSKTGVPVITYQDGLGDPTARYYWIVGVNELGKEGPKSQMATMSNAAFINPSAGVIVDTGISNLIYLVGDVDDIPMLVALTTGADDDPTMWPLIDLEDDYYASSDLTAYSLP